MADRYTKIYGEEAEEGGEGAMRYGQSTTDNIVAFARLPADAPNLGKTKRSDFSPWRIYRARANIETYVTGSDSEPTINNPSYSETYFHITIPTPALKPLRFTIKLDQADMDRGPTEAGEGPNPHTGKITFLVDQRMGNYEIQANEPRIHPELVGNLVFSYRDEYKGPVPGSTEPHAQSWEKVTRPGYGQGGGGSSQKEARMQVTMERMNDLATTGMDALRLMLSTAEKIGWLPHMRPFNKDDIDVGDIDSAYDGKSGYYYLKTIYQTNDNPYQGTDDWVQAAYVESTDGLRTSLKLIWNCIGTIATMLDDWKNIFNSNVSVFNSHTHGYYWTDPGGASNTSRPNSSESTYTEEFHETAQGEYEGAWTEDNVK